MFKFSLTSLKRMSGVHPDLVRCAILALQNSPVDFMVGRYGGLRTPAEQQSLLDAKVTRTLKSKHLAQADGFGHALDLWVWHKGFIPWNDEALWHKMANEMLKAADELGIKIRWGGDWDSDGDTTDQAFNDLPHFELVAE